MPGFSEMGKPVFFSPLLKGGSSQEELSMTVSEFITKLDDIAWGSVVLCLLVGVGVILSISTRFLQFRKFGYAMKNTLGKVFTKQKAGKGEVTPLQALTTALAATVGTGNIAGVTGAIVIGGPGAVFCPCGALRISSGGHGSGE